MAGVANHSKLPTERGVGLDASARLYTSSLFTHQPFERQLANDGNSTYNRFLVGDMTGLPTPPVLKKDRAPWSAVSDKMKVVTVEEICVMTHCQARDAYELLELNKQEKIHVNKLLYREHERESRNKFANDQYFSRRYQLETDFKGNVPEEYKITRPEMELPIDQYVTRPEIHVTKSYVSDRLEKLEYFLDCRFGVKNSPATYPDVYELYPNDPEEDYTEVSNDSLVQQAKVEKYVRGIGSHGTRASPCLFGLPSREQPHESGRAQHHTADRGEFQPLRGLDASGWSHEELGGSLSDGGELEYLFSTAGGNCTASDAEGEAEDTDGLEMPSRKRKADFLEDDDMDISGAGRSADSANQRWYPQKSQCSCAVVLICFSFSMNNLVEHGGVETIGSFTGHLHSTQSKLPEASSQDEEMIDIDDVNLRTPPPQV